MNQTDLDALHAVLVDDSFTFTHLKECGNLNIYIPDNWQLHQMTISYHMMSVTSYALK